MRGCTFGNFSLQIIGNMGVFGYNFENMKKTADFQSIFTMILVKQIAPLKK